MQDSLIFRILKYGMEHDTFTSTEILKEVDGLNFHYFLSISAVGQQTGSNQMFYAYHEYRDKETGVVQVFINNPGSAYEYLGVYYRITPNAAATYVEMVELQEARKASTQANERALEAKTLAWISIGVAMILGVLSIVIQLFNTQKLEIVNPTEWQAQGGNKSKVRVSKRDHSNLPLPKQDTIKETKGYQTSQWRNP